MNKINDVFPPMNFPALVVFFIIRWPQAGRFKIKWEINLNNWHGDNNRMHVPTIVTFVPGVKLNILYFRTKILMVNFYENNFNGEQI